MLVVEYYVLFIFWTLTLNVINIHGQEQVFDLTHILLTGIGTRTEVFETNSVVRCTWLCVSKTLCQSVSYNTDSGVCYINHVTLTSPDVVPEYSAKYIFTEIHIRNDNGVLVFRAQAGIGEKTLESWQNQGHDDFTQLSRQSVGCLTVNNQLPCDKHFRSWRLDHWTNISKVKFAFYTNSQPVFFVTFDAAGTAHPDEAFRISRIVDSSVAELIGYGGPYNVDSITGFDDCSRRFYLSSYYDLCAIDRAWMMVNDGDHLITLCCLYDYPQPYPIFRYSKKDVRVHLGDTDDAGSAEVFAVFVTYNT